MPGECRPFAATTTKTKPMIAMILSSVLALPSPTAPSWKICWLFVIATPLERLKKPDNLGSILRSVLLSRNGDLLAAAPREESHA